MNYIHFFFVLYLFALFLKFERLDSENLRCVPGHENHCLIHLIPIFHSSTGMHNNINWPVFMGRPFALDGSMSSDERIQDIKCRGLYLILPVSDLQ